MLKLRGKPQALFLSDGSAIVTAWLIALTFPPLAPWWLVALGTVFAIVVAKHLYGGLGQNPFNPAMVAFAVCIVSFPALMSQWPSVGLQMPLNEQIKVILGLAPRVDALSGATPLDALKTALKLGEANIDVSQLLANQDIFGNFAGRGWEWVAGGYLLGGLWLWQRKIITWHIPVAFIGALALISGALWLYNPAQFASPLFHLLSGGAMLGAFFIATDPVSGCTTPRGKLIFGAGAGLLAYIIRVFGGYPGWRRLRRAADEPLRAAHRPAVAAADFRHEGKIMSAAPQEFSASGMALRTAAILFVFVIIFTGLLSAAYQWTKPAIEASAAEEKMKLVDEVLPRSDYDNDLLNDTLTLPPTPELGLDEATTLYRARKGGQPVALVFEAVAPDGYAGKVKLLLALRADGSLAGVRVTQHKETPGLGDYVDPQEGQEQGGALDRPVRRTVAGHRHRQGLAGQEGQRPLRLLRRRDDHPARRHQGGAQGRQVGRPAT